MASRRPPSRSQRVRRPPARKDRPWPVFVALALVTLAAYQPAWHGGMLWDDDAHLTPAALASWTGLTRIWTDVTVTQQYYPVANSAFWVMNRLWGHDPLGYHLVNILLHVLSALLIASILRRWFVPGSLVAAAIFALHPVHVESVAWMTELKNTLSGVFYLLAAAMYMRFDETGVRRWYVAALAAFVLALGSKTVTATFAAAMLVVFWWRRGRLDWRRDVVPLLPFLAVGATAGLGTAWLEYAWVGAKGEAFDLTMIERALLAARAVWFYAGKLFWPVGLIFMYPRWSIDQTVWWQYLFPVALVLTLGVLWALRGRTRAPLAAALLFCGTLFPALGFFNVFPFRYSFVADHFQYLASVAIIAAVSGALVLAVRRWRPGFPETAIALSVCVPLFVLTFQQSRQYADAPTLYRATLAANPSSVLAMNHLAGLLLDGPSDGWPEAAALSNEAVRRAPGSAEAHNNLGVAWQRIGRWEDAVREHREAIRLNPELAAAHYNLGLSLAAVGKLEEAASAYETSLAIFPAQPAALHNLSKVLMSLRRIDEAVERARAAARLAPESADIQMTLGITYLSGGALDAAIAAYGEALRLRPGWGEARHNLAMALRRAGRLEESATAFEEAERLLPGHPLVEANFAALLVSMNRLDAAVPRFERALQAADTPRRAELHNDFGIVLARLGRPDAAASQFEAALRLRPDLTAARDNLARVRKR